MTMKGNLAALGLGCLLFASSCNRVTAQEKKSKAVPSGPKEYATLESCQAHESIFMGSGNGYETTYYDCQKLANGKWAFLEDKEAEKKMAKELVDAENHRVWLLNALVSRPITDAEFKEVLEAGVHLLVPVGTYYGIPSMTSYTEDELDHDKISLNRQFNDDLLQQYQLRSMVKKAEGCVGAPAKQRAERKP